MPHNFIYVTLWGHDAEAMKKTSGSTCISLRVSVGISTDSGLVTCCSMASATGVEHPIRAMSIRIINTGHNRRKIVPKIPAACLCISASIHYF